MGFFITTVIFLLAGFVGIGLFRVLYNKGPETNLLHYTWVITATICCWLTWAIVYMAQMHPLVVPILKAEGE
ncbi:Vacuolar H+-ATPase V0 sector [Klebsormidium nitens]|uniref:Vacuolar H+-ATPase V0 sector n=1 Tax=Klebsormidium nitens TaxID=105231 RepID=A0A1Y1IKD3_KLENI|nr:Vacuolar H+-ATPase V0 sector [Klebsormidium nitens]|eukprot:GAQ91234.1 Vacuolar H+-ATPase V0 sector [Klebsormidium nitens]